MMNERVSRTEARQGSRGRPVLYVLIGMLLLSVLFGVLMAAFGFSLGGEGDTQFSDERPEIMTDEVPAANILEPSNELDNDTESAIVEDVQQ